MVSAKWLLGKTLLLAALSGTAYYSKHNDRLLRGLAALTRGLKKGAVDKKDCYFDKACHEKVDWEQVGELKAGIFKRLEMLKKQKASEADVKTMLRGARARLVKTGIPDDRVDYILTKWVKFVLGAEVAGDQKDCYFDKACHDKVDWKKVGELKGGILGRLRALKAKRASEDEVGDEVRGDRKLMLAAGIPDDRVDYILMKWVKFVFGKEVTGDQKDCYFDKACHDKVDWTRVGEIKGGVFERLRTLKARSASGHEVKEMMVAARPTLIQAGIPDDRADYILWKWAKFGYPGVLKGAEPFKAEDWETVVV